MGRVAVAGARFLVSCFAMGLFWVMSDYLASRGVVLRSAALSRGRPSLGAGCLPPAPEEAPCRASFVWLKSFV